MDDLTTGPLRIGACRVDPLRGELDCNGRSVRLDPRTLRLLLHLAARRGEVVGIDDLLDQVWAGVVVTPESVYQAITSLRRALGDDARNPTYIATVPKRGYRLVAEVAPWRDETPAPRERPRRFASAFVLACVALVVLGAGWAWTPRTSPDSIDATEPSVAVMPFLDLTSQAMGEEYAADGMTESLIESLSAQPGLRVSGPTASYSLKGQALPVPEIGRRLGVQYLVDGSLRRSGNTLHVGARLLRVRDGRVMWTAGYDRPQGDVVALQQDTSARMARSLAAVLSGTRRH
jgi:TolB-like protein/DNA-binding winged helix-turn-helix (wHTH) protein